MPWRMIGLVVLLVLVAAFATLNLSNRTDISLGLYVFREVPIFLSLLVAFLAGILVMVPSTIGRGRRPRLPRAPSVERAERAERVRLTEADEPVEAAPAPPQTETATSRPTSGRGKAKSSGSGKTRSS